MGITQLFWRRKGWGGRGSRPFSSESAWRSGLCAAAISASVVFAPSVEASPFDVVNPSPGEMARLPAYCPYTITYHRGGSTDPARLEWLGRLGPTLAHLHHYCWALLLSARAEFGSLSQQTRIALWRRSIADVQYVLRNGESDFVLVPELLYRIGTYHARLGEVVEAALFFERARVHKPDYWPAYVELAELNVQLGRRQKALEILQAGLAVTPDEEALRVAVKRVESGLRPSQAAASR